MDTPLFCPSVAIGSARWTRVQNRTISQAQWKCSAERAPGPEAFTRRNALQQAALAALAIGASAVGVPDSANALSKKRLLAKAGPEVVTEEGLVYRDITIGKGNSPRFGDSVAVHYSLFYDDFEVESSRESQGLAASPIGFTFGAESGPGAVMKVCTEFLGIVAMWLPCAWRLSYFFQPMRMRGGDHGFLYV